MTRPTLVQAPDTTLKFSISTSDTELTLTSLVDSRGNAVAMADFGTIGFCTLAPTTALQEEIISFTGITVNSDESVTLTGITRNLSPQPPYTTLGAGSQHGAGTVVSFSNNPQIYEKILDYIDGIAIAGAPDASLTAKGLVESATTAEIDADEDTGSTGANLSVRPDQLAASKYGVRLPSTTGKEFLDGVVGMVIPYTGDTAPTGFLFCDNSTVSNNTYANLLAVLKGKYGYGTPTTFTTTHGSDLINSTSHGLSNGQVLLVDTSASDLPAGLSANTVYYVINQTTNNFQLSTSLGGGAVAISDDGTGTHSYYTQFKVPDLRARFPLGYSASAPTKVFTFASRSSNTITVTSDVLTNSSTNELQTGQKVNFVTDGTTITGLTSGVDYYIIRVAYNQFQLATSVVNANAGTAITLSGDGTGTRTFTVTYSARALADKGGTETNAQVASHNHTLSPAYVSGAGSNSGADGNGESNTATQNTGSDTPNNMPLFTVVNYIIKT